MTNERQTVSIDEIEYLQSSFIAFSFLTRSLFHESNILLLFFCCRWVSGSRSTRNNKITRLLVVGLTQKVAQNDALAKLYRLRVSTKSVDEKLTVAPFKNSFKLLCLRIVYFQLQRRSTSRASKPNLKLVLESSSSDESNNERLITAIIAASLSAVASWKTEIWENHQKRL